MTTHLRKLAIRHRQSTAHLNRERRMLHAHLLTRARFLLLRMTGNEQLQADALALTDEITAELGLQPCKKEATSA